MTKVCTKCLIEKSLSAYHKRPSRPIGVVSSCKDCVAKKDAVKWAAKKERMSATNKEWRAKNQARVRESIYRWRKENADAFHAINKKSRAKHFDRVMASNGKRRAVEKRATPAWANMFFIAEAYRLARLRTKLTGIKWHVDHIVPLKGKTVCGLHVENNIQVIPAQVNVRKNNQLIEEML